MIWGILAAVFVMAVLFFVYALCKAAGGSDDYFDEDDQG